MRFLAWLLAAFLLLTVQQQPLAGAITLLGAGSSSSSNLVPEALLDLLDERQGWGEAAADDAATYDLCTVTSGADSGAGTLRACLESVTPYWVVFDPSVTTVSLTALINVTAKKVIDCRDVYTTITTSGLEIRALVLTGDDVIISDCVLDGGIVVWDVDTENGDILNSAGNVADHFVQFVHLRRAGDGAWDARDGLGQRFTLQNSLVTETFQGFNHTADNVSSLRNLFWNVRRRAMQMIDGKGYIAQSAIGGPAGESWDDEAILNASETLSDGSVYSDENAWRADGVSVGSTDPGGSAMNFNNDIEFHGAVTQIPEGTVNATFVTNSRANWDRVAAGTDQARWNVIWRACGGGPRNAVRSVYVVGEAAGTGNTIDLDALVTGDILAGDFIVVSYKGETAGGAANTNLTADDFTTFGSSGPGNIRVSQFYKLADGSENVVTFSTSHTSMEHRTTVFRSPGKPITSVTPSAVQTSSETTDPDQITVSPGTTERLALAVVTYGSDSPVAPRTSNITMREQQGSTTDLYQKLMVWDARFHPPPATFTADMADEGGGNVVHGGYFDIN